MLVKEKFNNTRIVDLRKLSYDIGLEKNGRVLFKIQPINTDKKGEAPDHLLILDMCSIIFLETLLKRLISLAEAHMNLELSLLDT